MDSFLIELSQFKSEHSSEKLYWDYFIVDSCPFNACKKAQEKASQEGLDIHRSFHSRISNQ